MRVIIVGGGYAGVACALRLAREARRRRHAVAITLVNRATGFVERIRLHQHAARTWRRQRSLRTLLARAGVQLVVGDVERIDVETRSIELEGRMLVWDRLVLAAGSQIVNHGFVGHVWRLEPDSVATLAERLRALPRLAPVAVVGTGLTGIETATEIQEAYPHLRVSLFGRSPVGADWSPAARRHLLRTFATLGIELHEDVGVSRVEDGRLLTEHGERAAALVIWTAGFEVPALARDAGLAVNRAGQALVDPQLRSISHPHVYVAGDLAAPVLDPGAPLPLGCKSALPMGAHVGDNLARELARRDPVPFDYATPFFCVSLGRRDGLIQWADGPASLRGRMLTGRAAAWFKEMICKSTWWSLVWESHGFKGVLWMRTGRAPARLPPGAIEGLHP
jgi:NADH dehydrogenase